MKTKFLVLLVGLSISFFVLSSFKNSHILTPKTVVSTLNEIVVNGAYDGHEDYGYNFIVKNQDGDEVTLTFQKVEASILDTFNLDTDVLLNQNFKITYTIDTEVSIDEDGFKNEDEIYTIIKLEKL